MNGIIKKRFTILYVLIIASAFIIGIRLFNLQIVKGTDYREQSEQTLIQSDPIKAPRGEILDRYGRPLVKNKMGFTLTFQKRYIKEGTLNKLILNVIKVMDLKKQGYIDTFPMTYTEPFTFDFSGIDANDEDAVEKAVSDFEKSFGMPDNISEQEIIPFLKDYYEIEDGYSNAELRKIIGVRYEMENRMFNSSTPYTFARDVSIEAVSVFREQSNCFIGMDITVEPIRQITNTTMASHIIGRVGVIYKEEYEQLKDSNYAMNDIIGKDGIEKTCEKYLKGTDGASRVQRSLDGKRTKVLSTQDATPGNYVVLTIDTELQKTLENSLRDTIASIAANNPTYNTTSGTGVVVDVNSGEILAMASYPTYNASTFNEDYKSLLANPSKPMWNRAVSGLYAPGSTFKMLTAIAALEEGTITKDEVIVDQGKYNYYNDSSYQPECWIYTDYHITHGPQNVTQAIENSCNYFFYDTGRRLGIENLNKYGKMFGLGEYTGIELEGEAKGNFASQEQREKAGKVWYPGDTLQAAIGQSDHLFTPLQLANYVATLCNGGTRYKLHIIKGVKSYDRQTSILDVKPVVEAKLELDPDNVKTVLDGMRRVSESGTASNIFDDFPIKVGAKTGTATVPDGKANGLFVAFAPFDNPQIAMAIIIEHAGHGTYAAPVAKDVILQYMSETEIADEITEYNTLIKD